MVGIVDHFEVSPHDMKNEAVEEKGEMSCVNIC